MLQQSTQSQEPQYQSQPPQYASPPPQQAFCRNCGQRINPGEKFCQNCGAPQYAPSQPPQYAQQQAFCRNCGQRVNPGKKFCRYCGAPLYRQPEQAYSAPQQAAQQKAEAMPQRPVYPPAQPQYYPQYAQQQKPKGHGGIIFLNILLASVCAALLIIGIMIIPGNIKNARIPIQVFEEFPPDEEISEQMRILEAGGSLFQQMPEGYVRPEHHEIAEWFHIDPDSDD